MILIKPSFKILEEKSYYAICDSIELAARTCYKSENKNNSLEKSENFISGLIKRGHESVLEHEKITVRIICDRGVSHELVRHRIASYSQESTRYCNYGKEGQITFVIPCWIDDIKEGIYDDSEEIRSMNMIWFSHMLYSENSYLKLLDRGWTPQQARSVLPNSLKTEIVITQNLRQWRYFLKIRAIGIAGKPHLQMLEITIPMLKEFQKDYPVFFEDLTNENS